MSSSRRPCSFFQRNACIYGDTCRNAHILPPSPSVPSSASKDSSETPICPFFLRARCQFGDECRKFHPPGSNPSLSSSLEQQTKRPCQYFSRGSCMKGDKCPFSHDRKEEPAPRPAVARPTVEEPATVICQMVRPSPPKKVVKNEQDEYAEPRLENVSKSTDRVLYNCSIHFGPGAAVLQVITPFESRRVLLSNIPKSAQDDQISAALAEFTTSAELQIYRSTLTATSTAITATLVFEDPAAAAHAVASIAGIFVGSNLLSAQLDLRLPAQEGQGVLRGRKVKMTWYGRRASAFVHYTSIRSAEEHCERLDGTSYRGHVLSASFRRPERPTRVSTLRRYGRIQSFPVTHPGELFTVMVRNLPLNTAEPHLKAFCQAASVAMDPPRCPEDSPTYMLRALERFGEVDSFDALPMTTASPKIVAFAQFQTAAAAAAAELELRATPPVFVGRTPFFIERTFSVKYSVPRKLFVKIKGALDLLGNHHTNMIRYYTGENKSTAPVVLVLHGSEPKVLGQVKTEVDRIVQGEALVIDGKNFWDEFFERVEGREFLDSLNARENIFVRSDLRTRTVRLFGPEQERVQARKQTLEKVAEVRAGRHVLPLRREAIGALLRGKLSELQDSLGEDALSLDVVARTLTLNGDKDILRRARTALATLESSNSLEPSAEGADCPVCFCELEDPVKLDCGHCYCRSCLQHYLRPSPQDPSFSVRKCMAEVQDGKICGLGISYSIIRSLLTSAEEDTLLRASFLSFVNEHPTELRYCPSPDCEMVYRPASNQGSSSFQCPSCLVDICPACNVEYHEGISCEEHQDNLTGGLAALAKWREEHGVKQCPNCHADIEKNGGCNHMTCALCKAHICWICMQTFLDEDSSGGVYNHLRKVHGGIM